MKITVYCGSASGNSPVYTGAAVEVGSWIAENGHILVYGAGRFGLMNEVAGAAKEHGGTVIGIIPRFLDSREGHRTDLDELIYTETMDERKAKMIELGDAFVALPGGVGTLEEISQIMALINIEKLDAPCLLYNKNNYYDALQAAIDKMVTEGFLSAEQRGKIRFFTSVDELPECVLSV